MFYDFLKFFFTWHKTCTFIYRAKTQGVHMKIKNLNLIPEKIYSGEITKKEAVDIICSFVMDNYPIFGLHKYDEDFRADVIVYFLERGIRVLELYNQNTADFFTYLYSNIMSYIQTKRRSQARASIKEYLTVAESANSLEDKAYDYKKIDYRTFEAGKVPYAFKPISAENLRAIFSPITSSNIDKKILILALKSCFYLTDDMIKKVSDLYQISLEDFYDTIQFCKNSISCKTKKHQLAIERRNYAYYHHKRYEHELEYSQENEATAECKAQIILKLEKHSNNWKLLNNKFEKGFLYLRPTNKTIAEILGICERQVSYYINCAKKDLEKLQSENQTDSNE